MASFRIGIYRWLYKGGEFNVAFRPHGVFYCANYPAQANWQVQGDHLVVDWKNYGIYNFLNNNSTALDGFAQGNPNNWRRIEFLREFNLTEIALMGNGFGSIWNFIWEKGAFEVEFRTDGFNHFVCRQYPSHSHWLIDESELVSIAWGQYGKFFI
jgi:hypothetical protein